MNRSSTPMETLGNALAFLLIFGILGFGAYFVYSIIFGEGDLISLGGTNVVRPTEIVVVVPPTLTPFAGGGTLAVPSSPTPLFQQPTAAPPTATATTPPTLTPLPTSESTPVLPPTPFVEPTSALPPTPIVTATPIEPSATPLPTETPLPTAIPPTAVPQFAFRPAAAGPDYSRGCSGFYIFGYVRDASGNPLPGLRVRVVSEFGLEIPPATTKTDPPGWYDVLISQNRSLWYVSVVDASNNALSPSVEVLNTGAFVDGSESCWHLVDFVRTS